MNWDELHAFVNVAQTGSFSRTAENLHLTQPAVSKRISSLERILGATLFDRVGRQVHLTEAGALLLPRAKEILQSVSDAERLVRNIRGEVRGELRIATSHHVGLHRLAPVLKDFRNQYPQVRLDIRFEDSEAAHALVKQGESELAVVTLDPNGPHGLHYERLWDDPLVFVVARTDALAGADTVTLEMLAERPAILPGLATFTGRIVRERFSAAGFDIRAEMETNYLETIGMLVGIGFGWSVLPATLLNADIVPISVATSPMRRHLGVVTNPQRTRSNASRALATVLESHRDRPAAD